VNRPSPLILLALLLAAAWSLSTVLACNLPTRASASGWDVLLGETRKLMARHFFTKADVYFHSGYYPSFFDQSLKQKADEETKAALASGERCGTEFLGEPRDWIDRMGRNFYASRHVHLGEGREGEGLEREILPWLSLSVQLDPDSEDSYTLAAYWLNDRLKKHAEAEAILRQGVARMPDNPVLLCELGRVFYLQPDKKDLARNVWETAWIRWLARNKDLEKPDIFTAQRILASLAELEEKQGRPGQTRHWLTLLKPFSPQPDVIQSHIDRIDAKPR